MTAIETGQRNGRARGQADKPFPMRTPQEKRDGYLKRWAWLVAQRSTWRVHWSDLNRHIRPRSARFHSSDRNRAGRERYNNIYDNTATRASRVLSAGLMAGMTSPARPWFRLTTTDQDLANNHDVRVWLDVVAERMQMVFNKSNVYRRLPQIYDDLGIYGTSATLLLSDFDTVIRMYPMTVGEYCLQQDYQGRITTVYREFERTVGEVVKEFGYQNCSTHVQQQFDNRSLEGPVTLLHVVEPRADQDRTFGSPAALDMPWRSIYMELHGDSNKILRESGFRRMRVLAPRWHVDDGDVYGISPGMEALGDIRQLQHQQLRKSQAIDYKTRPPLQVPQNMKGRDQDFLPGGINYFEPATILPFDQNTPHGGVRTAFDVDLPIGELLIDIQDVRVRIKQAYFEDMFLMIAHAPNNNMTATEVLERQEEKLLMIGPVLERLSNELLEPLIDITFQEMMEVGALPPPPEELFGRELDVQFISILAQAQQAVGITGVQQWMSDTMAVSQVREDVLDNINFDEFARTTAKLRGVPAKLLLDDASVQTMRETRAEALAAREQAEVANIQAKTAKDLAASPTDDGTALSELADSAEAAAGAL